MKKAFKGFMASLAGAFIGLGILIALFFLVHGGKVEASSRNNLLWSIYISFSLLLAASTWGLILGGVTLVRRALLSALAALISAGAIISATIWVFSKVGRNADYFQVWCSGLVVSCLAGAVGGAAVGAVLKGRTGILSGIIVGGLSSGVIGAFPLTMIVILYLQAISMILFFIPFLALGTWFGRSVNEPADQTDDNKVGKEGRTGPIAK